MGSHIKFTHMRTVQLKVRREEGVLKGEAKYLGLLVSEEAQTLEDLKQLIQSNFEEDEHIKPGSYVLEETFIE